VTDARPRLPTFGRGPAPLGVERVVRQLELAVFRRLDGMFQGDYRGFVRGEGSEQGESRLYAIGDDVRRMDWSLTARTGAPHIRDSIADRELELWMVVDQSASLAFGSALMLKSDAALAVTAALGFVSARAGNRFGAIAFGAGPTRILPARSGRQGVVRMLYELQRPAASPEGEPGSGLSEALDQARRLARRRGLVAVVSDFLGPEECRYPASPSRSCLFPAYYFQK